MCMLPPGNKIYIIGLFKVHRDSTCLASLESLASYSEIVKFIAHVFSTISESENLNVKLSDVGNFHAPFYQAFFLLLTASVKLKN